MEEMGQESYHGRQLFKWIYKLGRTDFESITDLSKALRAKLTDSYNILPLSPEESQQSNDGTTKHLFRLSDGQSIETVRIPDEESGRAAVCVSSQVGCALKCAFCATGALGFQRDLSVEEIIGQMMYLRQVHGSNAFTNVVFMGMGEPLLNFERVMTAVGIITDGSGFSHAAKRITISTSGIVPGINELARTKSKVRLAVSLNAATQEKREKIMPVSRKYSLDVLMTCLKEYTAATASRVTFEYAMFAGFNDGAEDVAAIARLVRGIPCKINLLAYNPVQGSLFERPDDEHINWFAKQLYPRVPAVTVRKSRGADISAACGQLAGERGRGGNE